jgi:hypothetical protein
MTSNFLIGLKFGRASLAVDSSFRMHFIPQIRPFSKLTEHRESKPAQRGK